MSIKDKKMIKLAENTIKKEELISLADWIVKDPQLTKGPLVSKFEEEFSNYVGTEYAVMVNSGSSANLLMAYSLLEAGYLRNKKVIVPAISWITTVSPFLQLGFDVFLCDSDKKNLGLNVVHLEQLLIKEKPSVLIMVHVLGHLNNMDEIKALCDKHNVIILEDACEALGTQYNGCRAGSFGLAGSFSFYYGHHISTIEGGAVTTNDRKLYNIMLSIRSHGWSRDVDEEYKTEWKNNFDVDDVREFYTFYFAGFNLRSTDLNAYLGISQLKSMELIVDKRETNYLHYKEALNEKFWIQESNYEKLSSFAFGLIVKNRIEVFQALKENNIEVRPLICGSMGRQPFWIKKYGKVNLPVADIIHDNGLYLPNHLYLSKNDIDRITDVVNKTAIPLYL
jgi:CDP-6-deoxy-D-xylo-4-hexulose-3-dehydrase